MHIFFFFFLRNNLTEKQSYLNPSSNPPNKSRIENHQKNFTDNKDTENSNNNKLQVNNKLVIEKNVEQTSSHDKSHQPEFKQKAETKD